MLDSNVSPLLAKALDFEGHEDSIREGVPSRSYSSIGKSAEKVYFRGPILPISHFGESLDAARVMFTGTVSGVATLAIVHYTRNKEKMGAQYVAINQITEWDMPEGVGFVRLCLRLGRDSICEDPRVLLGTETSIQQKLMSLTGFRGSEELLSSPRLDGGRWSVDHEARSITDFFSLYIETVFCDTEKDETILSRYASYLLANMRLLSPGLVGKRYWVIHVSSDKPLYIEKFRKEIQELSLDRNVFVNVFDHPSEGYGTEGEEHIDRVKRPNSTIASRRESLLREAVEGFLIAPAPNDLVIRLSIDDDDFVAPRFLYNLPAIAADAWKTAPVADQVVVGFDRIFVAYFRPDGTVNLLNVRFNRIMTGCKVSITLHDLPVSPFAIPERHAEVLSICGKNVPYRLVELGAPHFCYNRHIGNLSKTSKNAFIVDTFENVVLRTHSDLSKHLLDGFY